VVEDGTGDGAGEETGLVAALAGPSARSCGLIASAESLVEPFPEHATMSAANTTATAPA